VLRRVLIEEGQTLANTDPEAVRAAMALSDQLTPMVTAVMALPGFPIGPVDQSRIQRTADAMLEFGMLGQQYTSEVEQGTPVKSMIGP
jgi:hypothetical protein